MRWTDSETPRRSRSAGILVNLGIMTSTLVSGALASQAADVRLRHATPSHPTTDGASPAIFLLSWSCAVLLCFRHRRRLLIPAALIACLPPLFLPIDALPALIGLASVLVWARDRRARALVIVLATLATLTATWRDGRGTRHGSSFWNGTFHSGTTSRWAAMPWWQTVLITGVCVGAAVGVALLRRSHREADRADARATAALQTAGALERQATVLEEREALAREVHDVLGHRLSILSMQANALEVQVEGLDPALSERARQIQTGARGSMEDLRSLLMMLREGPPSAKSPADLTDIAALVQECIAAGTPVASNIFVDSSTPLEPTISRGAYRITTELLTNARKHAPGSTVTLEIRGDALQGLTITTTNDISPGHGSGSGSGLDGVATRARELGGRFTAGPAPDRRRFVASAHLPWRVSSHALTQEEA